MTDSLPDYQINDRKQLEQLKDDFLSAVSHELRSPLANIKMATQMLKVLFQEDEERGITASDQSGLSQPSAQANNLPERVHEALYPSFLRTRAARYIQILECECDREMSLLSNFLDLQQLDAGNYAAKPTAIDVQNWMPQLVEPFLERTAKQQQTLQFEVAAHLPVFMVDRSSLEAFSLSC